MQTSIPPSSVPLKFGREFSSTEWQQYAQTIRNAKQALGIERLCLITPVGSLPKTQYDTGNGSLLGATDFFQFATRLGFDTYQLDPPGKRKRDDASPYTGTVFSLDPITSIDLAPLATEEWGNLLSQETFERIVANNPNKDGVRTAYQYIFDEQHQALQEVYDTFSQNLGEGSQNPLARGIAKLTGALNPSGRAQVIERLNREAQEFLAQNQDWLKQDALYEALIHEYGNDHYPAWSGPQADLDRHLFNPRNEAEAEQAKARILELEQKAAPVIGAYKFSQFIAAKQREEFKQIGAQQGFQTMADRQVAFSDRDRWAYQKLFLTDWSMGAPPDYYSPTGQAWGFPVMDPEKLFNPDGSLGEGGQLLYRLYEKMFEENPGGLRIDHIVGLIDPWVYPAKARTALDGARLFSSPEHPVLGKYALVSEQDLDFEKGPFDAHRVKWDALTPEVTDRYGRIVDRILLPAAEEAAKRNGAPVPIQCEDLGVLTNPVMKIMEERQLSGIALTQYVNQDNPKDPYRGRNIQERTWAALGNHDTPPIREWAQEVVKNPDLAYRHAALLAEDLIPESAEREGFIQQLMHDPAALAHAKWVELFTSPARKLQVFFGDWLGLERYNKPGSTAEENWSLRIPKDFQKAYFEKVKQGEALNLPEVMLQALKARQIDQPELARELDTFSRLLKE
ncbi:MAG TPA: 4-alpha-glucanotransferase [Coleofasciculaceae cyanobacterium]|jgi:4-alpha-glucanotransferase